MRFTAVRESRPIGASCPFSRLDPKPCSAINFHAAIVFVYSKGILGGLPDDTIDGWDCGSAPAIPSSGESSLAKHRKKDPSLWC